MKKIVLLFLFAAFFSNAQQSYYNDVNLTLSGTALRDELATKITNTHTKTLSYTNAREALKIVDLVPGQGDYVYLLYGFSNNTCPTSTSDDNDHKTRDKADFGGGATCEWNREHTYAKSLGNPNLGTSGPGADAHHLRASDVQRNSSRGSLKFIDGTGNSGSTNGGWYPGDEWKGDVARMMMYMYLRYGSRCVPSNVAIGSTNSVDSNMIDLLLDWNAEDQVSIYEDNRNTYLGNASNTYGQGNRNPFIDNPNLATQIWGGTVAEDRWNTTPDTENPAAPTNLVASNITNTTVDLNWTASTDNIAVTGYNIYVDGSSYDTSATNSATLTGLIKNTGYAITVYAQDAAGNTSTVSNTENITTDNFIDTEAPSAITDLASSNIASTSVDLSWSTSTDNVAVSSYQVFQGGSPIGSSATNSYNVTGLTPETSYDFTVFAKDTAGNTSAVSNTVNITTLEASVIVGMYFQGFEGTDNDTWNYILTTPICSNSNDIWDVVSNVGSISAANTDTYFFGVQDLDGNCGSSTGETISFESVDLSNYSDITLSFSINIVGYDVSNGDTISYEIFYDGVSQGEVTITDSSPYSTTDWEEISVSVPDNVVLLRMDINVVQNGGSDYAGIDDVKLKGTSTLLNEEFEESLFDIYPNPTKNNKVTIALKNNSTVNSIRFYNIVGQLIIDKPQPIVTNNTIEVENIPRGIYIVKIENNTSQSVKRLIVQ